jgi:hypothetical protein
MYENREAILEECGDELTKVENTLEVLQANGSWFCFLLMVVLGLHLGRFLIFQAQLLSQAYRTAMNNLIV